MEVNITVILEMMQFFCAYYFLYTFVFAPGYAILLQDKFIKDKLSKEVEDDRLIKDTLLHEYQLENKTLKNLLITTIPIESYQDQYKQVQIDKSLYEVEKIIIAKKDIENTKAFLIDRLSQVSKHD